MNLSILRPEIARSKLLGCGVNSRTLISEYAFHFILNLSPCVGAPMGVRLEHLCWVAGAGIQHRQLFARNLVRVSGSRPSRP